jgi:hypothetical protein
MFTVPDKGKEDNWINRIKDKLKKIGLAHLLKRR